MPELTNELLKYWDMEVNDPDVFYITDGLMGYYPTVWGWVKMTNLIYCDAFMKDINGLSCKYCSIPDYHKVGVEDCPCRGTAQEEMI